MGAGRKPKPTAMKELEGNPGIDPEFSSKNLQNLAQ